jgi:hypothetical protein
MDLSIRWPALATKPNPQNFCVHGISLGCWTVLELVVETLTRAIAEVQRRREYGHIARDEAMASSGTGHCSLTRRHRAVGRGSGVERPHNARYPLEADPPSAHSLAMGFNGLPCERKGLD